MLGVLRVGSKRISDWACPKRPSIKKTAGTTGTRHQAMFARNISTPKAVFHALEDIQCLQGNGIVGPLWPDWYGY